MSSLKTTLANLDGDAVTMLVAAASDIALVVDKTGVIEDVSIGSDDFPVDATSLWRGRRWSEIVTVESRPKVEEMIRDALARRQPRGRQVSHPATAGPDVPVRYAAVGVGQRGRILALGSDLRSLASLQRKLVDAQQSMEHEYSRLRHAETRYRLLFKLATEPVVIIDALSQNIIEANPAACRITGQPLKKLTGKPFSRLFDQADAVQAFLMSVRLTPSTEDIRVRLAGREDLFSLTASLFRQENASHLLARLVPLAAERTAHDRDAGTRLSTIVERLPDGFVVTDPASAILTANSAFLELAQVATPEHAKGQPLSRWLGRSEIDYGVLIGNLREHGSVRLYESEVRGELGSVEGVEISAVAVDSCPEPCLAFTVRTVAKPAVMTGSASDPHLPRSVKQMTQLVGRVPLKTLIRETTDIIERLCIEAALDLSRDNRVSAAELLGLSRQSLYSKLRRYGLGDLGDEC